MKNWLITLILFIGLLSSVSAQLVFEQEDFVYEADLLDEKVEAVYKFQNVGDTTITVTSISTSCGCTTPNLDKKTYQPGESGEIKAVFVFGARIGKQHKRITVNTEGDSKKIYLLDLITDIPEWLELQPRVLRWSMADTPISQALLVEVPLHERIQLALPDESDNFDVRVQQTNPGKYTFFITPKHLDRQITEFMKILATASNGERSVTREFILHCLIR